MLDIPSISAIVAAASVLVGVVLTVLQLRDLVRTRQTDLIMRLYSTWGSEDLQNAAWKVLELQFKDYDDFVKKYGSFGAPANVAMFKVSWFLNGIGVLLNEKLADIKLINKFFGYMVIWIWEVLKPVVEGGRKQFNQPKSLEWFEYLYNEMKKREKKL